MILPIRHGVCIMCVWRLSSWTLNASQTRDAPSGHVAVSAAPVT